MFLVKALDLAAQATEHAQFKDWWWKVQLGKCYYRQASPHYLCYCKKIRGLSLMHLTFADSLCIEKQKNSFDLLSITKK